MSAPATAQRTLRELLHEEYGLLSQYVTLTEREQAALMAADIEDVERLAHDKMRLLERLSQARRDSRRALGEPLEPAALHDRLRAAGPGTRDLFELVAAKAREATTLTQLSARLLNRQMRRLHGRAQAIGMAGDPASGYTSSGFDRLSGTANLRLNA